MRDNLVLNVLTLIHACETIRQLRPADHLTPQKSGLPSRPSNPSYGP